jgi:predicted DNA-binding protein (UPF0251 family)/predicted Fe-Mo cluster-binding NifX family protein
LAYAHILVTEYAWCRNGVVVSRPLTERRVGRRVPARAFRPAGVPGRALEEVVLSLDEAESIRLADLEGLYQEAAALRMAVSRQTFGRIVEAARRKVADAIINGKLLRIEGGEVVIHEEGEKLMKVAVPAREGQVDEHFGHCEHFMVYGLDEGRQIASEERVDSPEGCGCKSDIAGTLARMGVTHMVAGNMGEGAVRVLHAHGIEVIRGASGGTREAVERFSAGTLEDSGAACAAHAHGHHGGKDCEHH